MKFFRDVGVLFAFLLLSCGYIYAAAEKLEHFPSVNLSLDDVKIDEVVNNVSKQVGYTIKVEGELIKSDVVSGRYLDVSLDKFFLRVFKNKNIVVEIDTHEKMVVIHLLGSSALSSQKDYVQFQPGNDPDAKVALSNVSRAELEDILKEEEQIHREWRDDPNAIMPFTSVTKAEYENNIAKEALEKQESDLDMERELALSSVTRSEAKLIFEVEGEKDLARRQDPKVTIALSDMTQSEYKEKVENEGRRFQEMTNEPNAIIPFSNVTYSEFRADKVQ